MKKRHAPKAPTVVPLMFIGGCILLAVIGYGIQRLFNIPAWFVLVFTPLMLALLPLEINYSLRRRRICAHIKEDFVVEEVGLHADYSSLLAEIHGRGASSSRAARSEALQATGPSTWPTTAPTTS